MRLLGLIIAFLITAGPLFAQNSANDSMQVFIPPPPVNYSVVDSVSPWNSGIPATNCTWGLSSERVPNEKLNLTEIEIFPNPSSGTVAINFSSDLDVNLKTITLRNALGQEIPFALYRTAEGLELSWDDGNGIYYIKIQTSSNIYRRSVILHR
ncbi:T9SS type A sorting domain-containing protein [bacterium]|nr:T9SS type A sorting domain-containing protein [bacterium]